MMSSAAKTQAILAHSWTKTLVVGHRGAADEAPENTLPAFEAGIASRADAVECDVHLSAEGRIVVIHDATLERTTSLQGRVDATTWATMRDAGVPSLIDVVGTVKGRSVLVVEIKEGEGIESQVVELLREHKMAEGSILFSFSDERLARVKSIGPEFTTVWLLSRAESEKDVALTLNRLEAIRANGVGCSSRDVTPEFVEAAHRSGFPVFVWTVPPGPDVDRLRALKVNFIITNDPRRVKSQLESGI